MTAWAFWLVQGCGTEAAYRRHLRANEKPCKACPIASAQAVARRRARRKAMA